MNAPLTAAAQADGDGVSTVVYAEVAVRGLQDRVDGLGGNGQGEISVPTTPQEAPRDPYPATVWHHPTGARLHVRGHVP
ncbi:hypothetical protein [Streptomyces mesophilus]|uniref:hypothetical protein n=1 Tax=Streptomyces mesophilus TaxID=1775132 RepID=UPI0033168C9A